jgi:exodeoxyribonuclease VII large subunit
VRAETPSAAAELITSHFVASLERAAQARAGMKQAVEGAVQQATERLDHARSRLRLLAPSAQIEQGYLRLDDFSNRLASALRASLQRRRQQLADARARQARHSPETRVQLESQRLLGLWKRLQSVSPASVLHRGFTIIRDEQGQPVPRRAGMRAGQRLTAEFSDGSTPLRAE